VNAPLAAPAAGKRGEKKVFGYIVATRCTLSARVTIPVALVLGADFWQARRAKMRV
jgi:hypothetical protein